ncbi:MAG: FAD-binding protein [Bacillota bacterium]
MIPVQDGPYHAVKVRPAVHCFMGGVRIDMFTRGLDKDGKAIEGLFAAGEVSGGVHGDGRVGGNTMLDALVFDRTARRKAAERR